MSIELTKLYIAFCAEHNYQRDLPVDELMLIVKRPAHKVWLRVFNQLCELSALNMK